MKFYLKQALIPAIYLIFMSFTAFSVVFINVENSIVRYVLLTLNLALYAYLVSVMAFKDGEDAVRIRSVNDLEREEIIRTGEDRPLKLAQEYKPWKGFLFGFIVCIPLLFFLLIYTIVFLCGGGATNIMGVIPFFLYLMVTGFVWGGSIVVITPLHIYFSLVAVVFISCCTGIPYLLGAKKIMKQQKMIEEKQHQIYGNNYKK